MPGRTNTRAEKEAAVAWRSDALETALRTTAPTLQAPAPPSRDEAGRQLEERLRERETTMEQTLRDLLQLRDMVDRSPAILGIAYDQLEHPMVYLSEGVRLFGYAPEEFTSGRRRWIDIIHPDDRARIRQECQGRQASFSLSYRVLTADNAIRWVCEDITPHRENGRLRLESVLLDVTERRLMTLSLEDSEKRFRQLFESMTEGCTLYELVYDRNGTPVDTQITAINPAGEAIIGKKVAELVGRRASQLIPDRKPLFLEIYGALDRGGPPVSIETRLDFLNKDLFLSFSSPRKGLIAATYTDITDRKEAEARMVQYQRQLRHLAAGIAMAGEQERRRIAVELHDGLGQALAMCKLKLESLQCDAKGTPFTRPLGKAVRLLEEAIRETRSLTFQLSPPVLHELGLGAAIDWLAEHLGARQNIAIRVTRASASEPADMAVKVILFQSVRELVFNAIKHAQAGVIAIDIRTVRGHLEIEVRDDGKGFEPDAQRGAGRTGMGLFNIQERVQLIGGAMLIKSRPGQGTQATLVAPLEAVAAEGQERRSP